MRKFRIYLRTVNTTEEFTISSTRSAKNILQSLMDEVASQAWVGYAEDDADPDSEYTILMTKHIVGAHAELLEEDDDDD